MLSGEPGDLTIAGDVTDVRQFFCEYAEIFHAFRKLRKRLTDAQESGDTNKVDYYLTGTGMDSLRTLLEQLDNGDTELEGVTKYLVLLCAREIYETTEFARDRLRDEQLRKVNDSIEEIRKDGAAIKLNQGRSDEDRRKFFDWFEKQFHRQYRLVSEDEVLA